MVSLFFSISSSSLSGSSSSGPGATLSPVTVLN